MKRKLVVVSVFALGLLAFAATARSYYCKYCGYKANSIATLTANKCLRHPNGALKGCHVLYEGAEKDEYVCKYCGRKASDLKTLTANKCLRHPNGSLKGNHSPAL